MATKERKTAIDIDDILLREVASRRSTSGSVLDMAPGNAPAAALPEEAPDPEPVRESVQEPVQEEARPARSRRQGTTVSPYEEVFLRRGVSGAPSMSAPRPSAGSRR